jgi:hypothetical protein
MLGYQGRVKKAENLPSSKLLLLERNTDDGFAGANFLSLGTGTSSSSSPPPPPPPPAGRVHKDLENHEIDLNSPPVDQYQLETKGESSTTYSTTQEEEEEESNSNNNRRSGTGLGRGRLQQQFSEVKNCRSSRGSSLNSKFQQQEVLVYRGVRHRSELNKWVTEIRPTAHKRKIWLGTYKSPEEAARAYDVGIHYTGKKIPLNFPESVKNLPELPQGLSWEELAPFVKKQALTAAKRARVEGTTTTTSELPQTTTTTTTKLFPKAITIRG